MKKISLLKAMAISMAFASFSFAFAITNISAKEADFEKTIEKTLSEDTVSVVNIQANIPQQEYEFLAFNNNNINTINGNNDNTCIIPSDYFSQKKEDEFEAAVLFDKTATEDKAEKPIVDAINIAPAARTVTFNARVYSDEEIALYALTPYKIAQDTDVIQYRHENMYDAECAVVDSSQFTDSDLYLMAKIIHAEICLLGDEARRSVGTAIINRVADPKYPNTISGVIYQDGQFSTSHTSKEPCEECYAAAYDVMYNGYRSFPWYVNSFQCICDGYFSGHNTYVEFNDGKYKTWFSYNRNNIT